jgi:hypothetical protein
MVPGDHAKKHAARKVIALLGEKRGRAKLGLVSICTVAFAISGSRGFAPAEDQIEKSHKHR